MFRNSFTVYLKVKLMYSCPVNVLGKIIPEAKKRVGISLYLKLQNFTKVNTGK